MSDDLQDLDLTDKIVVGEQVNLGGFSDIYQGTLLKNGTEIKVAIKLLRFHGAPGPAAIERLRKRFFREVLMWRRLKHRNIVPLLGYTMPLNSSPAMVSPWYPGGNIIRYLGSCSNLDRRALALDVINGLDYLHSIPVAHGDLKGENVLVDASGRASLCDFGMSQFIDEATQIAGYTTSTVGMGGTDRFTCPELWSGDPKSTATDVWAVGCLIVQILTDEMPYHNLVTRRTVFSAIIRGDPPWTSRHCEIDTGLWGCIEKCWSLTPDERPRVSEIKTQFSLLEVIPVATNYLKGLAFSTKINMPQFRDSGIRFSPDGKCLAVASGTGCVSIWDAGKRVLKPRKTWNLGYIGEKSRLVRHVAWSASQRHLLVMSYAFTKIFSVETDELILEKGLRETLWADFLPDGSGIVLWQQNGNISVVDLSQIENTRFTINPGLNYMNTHAVVLHPDNQRIIIMAGSALSIYDMTTGELKANVPLPKGMDPHEPLISKDGRYILSPRFRAGVVELWGLIEDESNIGSAGMILLNRYTSREVSDFSFSPVYFGGTTDELIIGVAVNNTRPPSIIHIWDRKTVMIIHSFEAKQAMVIDVCFRWGHGDSADIVLAAMTSAKFTSNEEDLEIWSIGSNEDSESEPDVR